MKKLFLTLVCLLSVIGYAYANTENISLKFDSGKLGGDAWGSGYTSHTYTYKVDGVNFAEINFSSANKQSSNIKDYPVTAVKKDNPTTVTVKILNGSANVSKITFNFLQWPKKTATVNVATSTDGTTFDATDVPAITIGTTNTITATGENLKGAQATLSSTNTSNQQVGIESIVIEYTEEVEVAPNPLYLRGTMNGWPEDSSDEFSYSNGAWKYSVQSNEPIQFKISTIDGANWEAFNAGVLGVDDGDLWLETPYTLEPGKTGDLSLGAGSFTLTVTKADDVYTLTVTGTETTPRIEYTIYYDNTATNWDAVSAYIYGNGNQITWPGLAMTKGENNVWSVTKALRWVPEYVIFNNNGQGQQYPAETGFAFENGATYDKDGKVVYGTSDKPYTVADVLNGATESTSDEVWVKGYIVGTYVNNKVDFGVTDNTVDSNLALAPTPDTNDASLCIPVELKKDTKYRTNLNLKGNASVLGREVMLNGDLTSYFSQTGIKNLQDYVLYDYYTVTFDAAGTDWTNVNCYMYEDATEKYNAAWPGVAMEAPVELSENKWTVTCSLAFAPDHVIFNNGDGAQYPEKDGFEFENGATYTKDGKFNPDAPVVPVAPYLYGFSYKTAEMEEYATIDEAVLEGDVENNVVSVTVENWAEGTEFFVNVIGSNFVQTNYTAMDVLENSVAYDVIEDEEAAYPMTLDASATGLTVTLSYNIAEEKVTATWTVPDPEPQMPFFYGLFSTDNSALAMAEAIDEETSEPVEQAQFTAEAWQEGTEFYFSVADMTGDYYFYTTETVLENGVGYANMKLAGVMQTGGVGMMDAEGETGEGSESDAMFTKLPMTLPASANGQDVEFTYDVATKTLTASWTVPTYTVYFDNSYTNWDDVYAYSWNGDENGDPAYPGTKLEANNHGQFVYTVEIAAPENLIFNNGKSDDDERKTADLAFVNNHRYDIFGDKADSRNTYTIFYNNEDTQWEQVYAHVYNKDGGTTPWNCVAMIEPLLPTEDWVVTLNLPFEPTNVIFNNGEESLDAFEFVNGGHYFSEGLIPEGDAEYAFGIWEVEDGFPCNPIGDSEGVTLEDLDADGYAVIVVDEWVEGTQFIASMMTATSFAGADYTFYSSSSILENDVETPMMEVEVDMEESVMSAAAMTLPASANGKQVTLYYDPANNMIKAVWDDNTATEPEGSIEIDVKLGDVLTFKTVDVFRVEFDEIDNSYLVPNTNCTAAVTLVNNTTNTTYINLSAATVAANRGDYWSDTENCYKFFPEGGEAVSEAGEYTLHIPAAFFVHYPTTLDDESTPIYSKEATINFTIDPSSNITTGIESIFAPENGDVEIYNIQGVRVDANNLAKGLYIVRQGNKASKVLVK